MSIYSQEHEAFRRAFRKFVDKEIVPYRDQWEANREIPRELWKKMGGHGYLCPWVDKKYGGSGAGFEYCVIINEELVRADVGMGIGLHSDIIAPYIYNFGTGEQKDKWLPGCVSGDIILAVAMTEPNAGSDLQGIKTKAVRDGDEYVINGQKVFISNGIFCDLVLVCCKTDPNAVPATQGFSLIAVEEGTPGFIKGRKLNKLGLHINDTAELFFEDCRVPASNLLGGEEGKGFYQLMDKLQRERLITTVGSQVSAECMLADVIDYAGIREAFGQPIGKFQHNAFKIAEMATEVELGRSFLDSLIADHLAGKDITLKVSMAKWWISEMANRVAYQSLQMYGGYGYMEEYPISRRYRDIRAHTIVAGSTEIMKLVISRMLGF